MAVDEGALEQGGTAVRQRASRQRPGAKGQVSRDAHADPRGTLWSGAPHKPRIFRHRGRAVWNGTETVRWFGSVLETSRKLFRKFFGNFSENPPEKFPN